MTRSPLKLSFLLIAFLLTCVTSVSQAEEPLRYKFQAGQRLGFNMVQETNTLIKQPGGKEVKSVMKQTTKMVWKVLEMKKDGNAVIEQRIYQIKMEMQAPGGISMDYDTFSDEEPAGPIATMVAPLLNAMTKAPFKVTMAPSGEIVDLEVPKEITDALKKSPNAAMMGEMFTKEGFKKMVQQGTLAFPKGEMKKGTIWKKNFDMKNAAMGGKVKFEATYVYKGEEEVKGKKLEKFGVGMKLDFETKAGGPQIKVTKQTSEGTIYFDRSKGQMASSNVNSIVEMAISVGPQNIEMVMKQNVNTRVVEAPTESEMKKPAKSDKETPAKEESKEKVPAATAG